MSKRILIAGIGQTNFLFQLYEPLTRELKDNFEFISLNLKIKSIEDKCLSDNIFSENFTYNYNLNKLKVLIIFLKLIFKKHFLIDIFSCFLSKDVLFNFKAKVIQNVNDYALAKYVEKTIKYDYLQIHFPTEYTSNFYFYLKKKQSLLLTFWGSDIYRNNSIRNLNLQSKLLQNCKKVTVSTPEMQFVLFVKFGFELKYKAVILKFISQENYFIESNKLLEINKSQYKFENNIPLGKKIIVFGHNASSFNNHLKFIRVIQFLNFKYKEQIHIIFPLTYGENKDQYINQIKEASKDISCTYLENYLNAEELVRLKKITNIYIHAPTTDGLSSFLTEYFYENITCIVGDWLPYKTFKNLGVDYIEFKEFQELEELIPQVISEHKIFENKAIIEDNFREKVITEHWKRFYNAL